MNQNPKTKASELLEKLSIIISQSESISEFELASLRREASASLKTDPFHGYMALAALAALTWDNTKLDENHKHAIALGDPYFSRTNYAVSLSKVLRYEDAASQMRFVTQIAPEELGALRQSIQYSLFAGQLKKAIEIQEKLTGLTPQLNTEDLLPKMIANVLARSDINEAEFSQSLSIVFDTLREQHLGIEAKVIRVDEAPDELSVLMKFTIKASPQRAQAMHKQICARLCEELPNGGHPETLMFWIVGNRLCV